MYQEMKMVSYGYMRRSLKRFYIVGQLNVGGSQRYLLSHFPK